MLLAIIFPRKILGAESGLEWPVSTAHGARIASSQRLSNQYLCRVLCESWFERERRCICGAIMSASWCSPGHVACQWVVVIDDGGS